MLTLVVIAKNEADRIGRCLDSVPFAQKKLVLDSGSSDGTPQIANRHGAEVVHTDWPGFVAQKNRGLDLVDTPWALSLDADEWLTGPAKEAVQRAMHTRKSGFSLPRENWWMGRPMRHGTWYPDRRIRLVRPEHARWVGDDPHDHLEVAGPVGALDGDIGHVPYRRFRDHLSTIERYSRINAASLHARGVRARVWDPALHASGHLLKALVLKQGVRDGWAGLALAGLGAVHSGLKWHRLRQLG